MFCKKTKISLTLEKQFNMVKLSFQQYFLRYNVFFDGITNCTIKMQLTEYCCWIQIAKNRAAVLGLYFGFPILIVKHVL